MKFRPLAAGAYFVVSQVFASDFQPNPSWVADPQGHSGYTAYEDYTEVPTVDAGAPELDPDGVVRFANRTWRGGAPQFLENRVRTQNMAGKPCNSSVLLKNGGKWIEMGRASVQDPATAYHQVFLLYEWDENEGGARKSSFFLKDEIGLLKLGEVIEIGKGLALVKVAVDVHEWVNLLIIDLTTFRPKGLVAFSDMEIVDFTFGQKLKIRYECPVTRAQILSNENAVQELDWENLDIITNGSLNPDVVDESQFEISIPATQ